MLEYHTTHSHPSKVNKKVDLSKSKKIPIQQAVLQESEASKSTLSDSDVTSNSHRASRVYALKIFGWTVGVLFICEAVVMTILQIFALRGAWDILLDPILLAILSTPLLFYITIRPLRNALKQYQQAKHSLETTNHKLENSTLRSNQLAKKAEASRQAMMESDKLFMSTFRNSVDAVLLIGEGIFIDCNAKTVEMLRATNKEDVLLTHPSELSPETQPDGRESHEKADEMIAIARQKGSNRFEWAHRRLDGEVFPVEVTLTPVSLFGKQQLYCVWKDITEQKQAEEKLNITVAEIERMNRLMTGREMRVIGMKKEVNSLLGQLGRELKYTSVLENTEVELAADSGVKL